MLVGSLAILAGLVAQSNVGQLHGKVTDTSRAALPETYVEIRRAAGGERRTVTDAKGDVTVAAGSVTTITFALEVAGVAETVTVTGETPIVDVQAVAGRVGGGRSVGLGWGVAGSPFNTEAYDKIDDNQWTDVGRKPLSIFSIDVDTASYAN